MNQNAENFNELSESKESDLLLGQVPHQLKLNPSKRKIVSIKNYKDMAAASSHSGLIRKNTSTSSPLNFINDEDAHNDIKN